MARPATQGIRKTRRKESAINDIVLNSTKQIRQRLIDEYWFGRLDLVTGERGPNWKPISQTQYLKMSREEKIKINLMIEPLIIEENGPLKTLPGWEIESGKSTWNSYEDFHFPSSVKTNEEFAAGCGVSKSDWDEILGSRKVITVKDLVNIANLGDVDIAYMFTPPSEDLEVDTILEHQFPNQAEEHQVRMHRWIMWVKGIAHLPEQDPKKYLQETSLAPLQIDKISHTQKDRTAVFKSQIEKQKAAKTAALNLTEEENLKRKTPNLDLDPFKFKRGAADYETSYGVQTTNFVNRLSTSQKFCASLAFRNTGNIGTFLKSFAEMHGALVGIIRSIFGMGEK
jgi:hypothetical protein